MPGSYRQLTHIIHPPPALQNAKITSPPPLLPESDPSLDLKDGSEGKWSEEENLSFCIFVHYFQDIFSSKHKRKYFCWDLESARFSRPLPSI